METDLPDSCLLLHAITVCVCLSCIFFYFSGLVDYFQVAGAINWNSAWTPGQPSRVSLSKIPHTAAVSAALISGLFDLQSNAQNHEVMKTRQARFIDSSSVLFSQLWTQLQDTFFLGRSQAVSARPSFLHGEDTVTGKYNTLYFRPFEYMNTWWRGEKSVLYRHPPLIRWVRDWSTV